MKCLLFSLLLLFAKCGGVESAMSDAAEDFFSEDDRLAEEPEVAAKGGVTRVVVDDNDRKTVLPARLKKQKDVMLYHEGYVCSFNRETLTPNYVAWVLTADRTVGEVKREDMFYPDEMLPEELRVETQDYSRSGYDRGHMCPAADNRYSAKAMKESFYMSNVCPQNHDLNAEAWNELEIACRRLAKKHGKVYIVAGPIYGKEVKRIGKRKGLKVAVPEGFFKVILVLGETPEGVGFIMPNKSVGKAFKGFAVSIDDVEKATGYDFFPALPDKTEKEVEKQNLMIR